MSRPWVLTVAAEDSLADILLWTARRWGLRQARAYEADLRAGFDRIAAGALPGRSCRREWGGGLPERQRFAKVRSHVVVWEETEDRVVIVDVLHERMDVARRVRG